MRKATAAWLVAGVLLVIAGFVLVAAAMAAVDWNWTGLHTGSYEANSHPITEPFDSLSIVTDTADLVFARSEDGTCRVECYEDVQAKHRVTVQDGTLQISVVNEKNWYAWIGWHSETPKVTVYLPNREYAALSVKTTTGDITVPADLLFEQVELTVSTGDIRCEASVSGTLYIETTTGDADLVNVRCKNLETNGTTGDLHLKNVIAEEAFRIVRDTGDVSFDGCDAAEICVETDTGDVEGTLLSEKVFVIATDTGDVSIPNSNSGGTCRITTDTGDIELDLT